MLVLAHGPLKALCETGRVEVWSPALDRCRSLELSPAEALADHEALWEQSEPALNVFHVVRRRRSGGMVTRAKGASVRPAVLQALTYPEARAAGFKTRDAFYDWWRLRYATGPRMATIPCWVTTYEQVADSAPMYLQRDVWKGGDYTANSHDAIDEMETVDASEWARKSESDRGLIRAQRHVLSRRRRPKPSPEEQAARAAHQPRSGHRPGTQAA